MRKVYEYSQGKVRRTLQSALRQTRREASVADLVSKTGLPNYQVGQTLNTMLDDYRGQLKATESGELLYYFPEGFRNRKKGLLPWLRHSSYVVGRSIGSVLVVLFKVWIVVMLVGYFILFVALLIAALFASIAGTAASRNTRSRSRMGGFGTFYLTTRLIQIAISLWIHSSAGKKRRGAGRPLHQSVFAFAFGDKDPASDWDGRTKRYVIGFIQASKGVISVDEIMTLTGRDADNANLLMNEMLREYEGMPNVTDDGTIYYQFPSLMMTTQLTTTYRLKAERKALKPFNNNPKKMNRWISFFNGFNLLFGSYFLYWSLIPVITPAGGLARLYLIIGKYLSAIGNPVGFMFIGLGVIPVAFSFVFFLVSFLRRLIERRRNEKRRVQNLRKVVYESISEGPEYVLPGGIVPSANNETPRGWEKQRGTLIENYAAAKEADIEQDNGKQHFVFRELRREQKDMIHLREGIDPDQFKLGREVYDSRSGES